MDDFGFILHIAIVELKDEKKSEKYRYKMSKLNSRIFGLAYINNINIQLIQENIHI